MKTQTPAASPPGEAALLQYQLVRRYTEELCGPLSPEDYSVQPAPFASPAKWHLAHTTWFFEEFVLCKHLPGYEVFHPDFSYLFNSYYNAVGDRILRAERGNMTRPPIGEVYRYRQHVDAAIERFFEKHNPAPDVRCTLEIGCHHEQQHQELLLTDLKYAFGHNPLFPVYREGFSLVSAKNPPSKGKAFLDFPEGIYHIGHRDDGFCYDNELGPHRVFLEAFEISKKLVTNGEFLDFMVDGGYGSPELWHDDGWTWVRENDVRSPLYWHLIDGEWHQYTLGGLQKLDPEAQLCHVSFYEAAAFAEWKGLRLPTEFEWEAAAPELNWGTRWEWTNSAYLPYPGFAKAPGALGEYNGKFMVNQMVLRGASTATSPGHSRRTYRNFFQPNHQWQCAGIRLAKKQ